MSPGSKPAYLAPGAALPLWAMTDGEILAELAALPDRGSRRRKELETEVKDRRAARAAATAREVFRAHCAAYTAGRPA